MSKILVITASSGKNLELANSFAEELKHQGATPTILNLMDLKLPLYDSHSDSQNDPKALLGEWLSPIHESQGYVFLAPEFNGSTPPVFSNFLCWVSRSAKDWRVAFNEKPAAIGTFSAGGSGFVLNALRMQLAFIGMNVLGRQILTNFNKPLDHESLKAVCKSLIKQTDA